MLKPWKAVVGIAVLGFIILVIVGALGGLKVEKNTNKVSSTKTAVVSSSSSSKTGASVEIKTSTSTNNSSEDSSSTEASSSVEVVEVKENEGTTTEPSATEIKGVNFPDIVSEGSSNGIITEKKVYQVNNTFIFNLCVTLATKEVGTVTVDYFTSANNYNTVNVGDLLYIEYGVDSKGNVAIAVANTISE